MSVEGWSLEVTGARADGALRVRLDHKGRGAELRLALSPSRNDGAFVARTRVGDLTILGKDGLDDRQADAVARRFAAHLEQSHRAWLTRFPHLELAHTGRAPDLSLLREALGASFDARPLPPLEPEAVRAYLEPEIHEVLAMTGCVLREIEAGGATLALHFTSSGGDQRWSVALARRGDRLDGFGHTGALVLEAARDLDAAEARTCSLIAALITARQRGPGSSRAPRETSTAPPRSRTSAPLSGQDQIRRYAIEASGFAIVRGALAPEALAALGAEADLAFDAMRRAVSDRVPLEYTYYDKEVYLATRCLYCWGPECRRLLEHPVIHDIARATLGADHRLFDMTAHSALPARAYGPARTERWHRDIDVVDGAQPDTRYLWFLVCLDDFTQDNGATWVVPGSHRIPSSRNLPEDLEGERYPTRVQLIARAGDLLVLNPSALHTVGHNATDRPRRMINVSLCRSEVRPLLDHWAIAGPAVHEGASERLRRLLGAVPERPLDTTWSVLPEGWRTGRPESERAERVFTEEQRESFQPTTLHRRES